MWCTASMTRTKWIISTVVVIAAVVAFAMFRPDTLFTDRAVDERIDTDVATAIDRAASEPATDATPDTADAPAPDAATDTTAAPAPDAPVVLSTGEWRSVDHETTGRIAVVRTGGRTVLIFDELETDNGPDLSVWVSTSGSDALATSVSGATQLEGLKGNRGTQSYELPAGLDAAALRSVVIWCDRFSVGFGVADLTPV